MRSVRVVLRITSKFAVNIDVFYASMICIEKFIVHMPMSADSNISRIE